jgi:hypothetical protein
MKTFFYWIIAIVITLGAAVYQRMTGPTYPARMQVSINGKEYKFKLVRSHGGNSDCPVILKNLSDTSISAVLHFKKFPSTEEYTSLSFIRTGDSLISSLPNQPAAGKLEYYVQFLKNGLPIESGNAGPVLIRYKGEVPAWVLIPHILFMFFAMLLANLAGVMAIGKAPAYKINTRIALILLFIGGMILGPLVQKYAFDAYWTGIPFGFDLTDNKTLIGFTFWVLAWLGNIKKDRPWLTILAAIALLAVYSIPHSMWGSQLNYQSGQVQTGMILFF